jgi:hypothetical protein
MILGRALADYGAQGRERMGNERAVTSPIELKLNIHLV